MRKTKRYKKINKYYNKTRKNNKMCKKGITNEVMIIRELINKFQKQLLKHDAPAEIKIYDDAPHGFCADYRETYRPDAAKLAWREMCAFFKRHHV